MVRSLARPSALSALVWLGLTPLVTGCIGNRIQYPVAPTSAELAAFMAAGPVPPTTDEQNLVALNVSSGEYRVVAGDLLEIDLPVEAAGRTDSSEEVETLRSRVSKQGTIRLPLLKDVKVGGKTLAEIEAQLVARYHPEFVTEKPNIVLVVADYREASVAVLGAVSSPGIHQLRSDRLSLLGALMAAGGIDEARGASAIKLLKADGSPATLAVRDSTIPYADVALEGGETIIVEPGEERQFTAIGLVKRSGSHNYPRGRRYNLMQALAVAGGTDDSAAPRYATIYRKDAAGEVLACTFKIDGTDLLDASNVEIKPGDVIAVDHTQGSWLRQFLSQVLGFRANVSATSAEQL